MKTASFEDFAKVQATVRATESAVASSQLPGRILRMNFDEGWTLSARANSLPSSTLKISPPSAQNWKLRLNSSKTSTSASSASGIRKLGSEVQFLQAKNNYDRVQKQLASIDVQSAKKNVYAPISGTVDQVMMRQGETASPGLPILSILNTNDLDVVADASENLLTKVKLRQKVKVKVPAINLEFMAPITRIGKTVDPANRTFEVEIDVPRKYLRQLKANLLAEVEVLDYSAENVIVVSQDQIQQEIDGRRFVFLATDGGDKGTLASKTYIETGNNFDNKAVIESGLKVGDRIITAGSRGLTDGQKVSLSQNPIQ